MKFKVGDKVVLCKDSSSEEEMGTISKIDFAYERDNFPYIIALDNGGVWCASEDQIRLQTPTTQKTNFAQLGKELGELVDTKQEAYGNAVDRTAKVIKVFLEPYKTEEGYLITEDLLDQLLLQVRIMDKQCRIFSNPSEDKLGESPYKDIAGYGLLGTKTKIKLG